MARSACVQTTGFPVGVEDQVTAGADLEAVAARLVAVQEERLPDGVLVRAGFNRHVGIAQDVGRPQHVLAAVHHVGEVMQPARRAAAVVRDGDVVRLVGGRQPRAHFRAVIEDDLLGQAQTEQLLEEPPGGSDVARQKVDVIEAPRRDAARHVPLRLVLEGRRDLRRRHESLRLPVQLDGMAVGRRHSGRPDHAPTSSVHRPLTSLLLEPRDELLEGRVVAHAKSQVPESRRRVGRQLERVPLVVAPGPQIDGVARPCRSRGVRRRT